MSAWGTAHGILGNDWERLDDGRVTVRQGKHKVTVSGDVVIGEFPREGRVGLMISADRLIAVTEGGVEREK